MHIRPAAFWVCCAGLVVTGSVTAIAPVSQGQLAEDPWTLEHAQKASHDAEHPWRDKTPAQLRSWAADNLHHKLTARRVIVDREHPEWAWFRRSGLGLFLHWGLPSANPDTGDAWAVKWSKRKEEIGRYMEPAEKMWSVADTWNPDQYDPDRWLSAAKKAGFGYSVLTTRHHDGYALWPSDHGTWDTGQYMNGRDLVGDYVAASRANDMRIGFYYSGPNWHFDYKNKEFEFPPTDTYTVNHKHEHVDDIPDHTAAMRAAEAKESRNQVRELMTRYGPIDVIWWDGNVAMSEEEIRPLQPNIFVARGNIATPEGGHQGASVNVKVVNEAGWWWEACRKSENTFTPNWHYGVACETNHWDTNTLLTELIRCRSLGGNLLVNVPPRGNGQMMAWYYQVCDEMSQWMDHSRESVYDVDLVAPLPTLDKTQNFTTVKGAHWYALPDEQGAVLVEEVDRPVWVTLLRTGDVLAFDYVDGKLSVVVPSALRTSLPDMVKITF